MWFTDILLIIVGIIAVIISYRITTGENTENQTDEFGVNQIWSENDEKAIRRRVDTVLDDKIEVVLDQTEDELSKLSNEKIMAVHEISEQVLGKIEKNHSDVVFLYNMLNEKEAEIKKLLNVVERKIVSVKEEMPVKNIEKAETNVDIIKENTAEPKKVENHSALQRLSKRGVVDPAPKKAKESRKMSVSDLMELNATKVTSDKKTIQKEQSSMVNAIVEDSVPIVKESKNEDIIKLHNTGKSVLEISKELDMGQGEVKFIIDLFGK